MKELDKVIQILASLLFDSNNDVRKEAKKQFLRVYESYIRLLNFMQVKKSFLNFCRK